MKQLIQKLLLVCALIGTSPVIIGAPCTLCNTELREDMAIAGREIQSNRTLSCGHTFHYTCVYDRLAQNSACPTCNEVPVNLFNLEKVMIYRGAMHYAWPRMARSTEGAARVGLWLAAARLGLTPVPDQFAVAIALAKAVGPDVVHTTVGAVVPRAAGAAEAVAHVGVGLHSWYEAGTQLWSGAQYIWRFVQDHPRICLAGLGVAVGITVAHKRVRND